MKFYRNFFFPSCGFLGGGGFLSRLPNRRQTCLLCCRQRLLTWGMNIFWAGDECFSAGDERIGNASSNFSHTHIHVASYQRLSNRNYFKMIATHRYSSPKTGGSYHALVFTSEYATPTSYTRNSILCWTKRPSSRLS